MSTTQILDVRILIYCILIREFPLGLLLFVDHSSSHLVPLEYCAISGGMLLDPVIIVVVKSAGLAMPLPSIGAFIHPLLWSIACWVKRSPSWHLCYCLQCLLFVTLQCFLFFFIYSLFFFWIPLCVLIGFNPDRYFTVKDHYTPLSFQLASYIYHIVIDL